MFGTFHLFAVVHRFIYFFHDFSDTSLPRQPWKGNAVKSVPEKTAQEDLHIHASTKTLYELLERWNRSSEGSVPTNERGFQKRCMEMCCKADIDEPSHIRCLNTCQMSPNYRKDDREEENGEVGEKCICIFCAWRRSWNRSACYTSKCSDVMSSSLVSPNVTSPRTSPHMMSTNITSPQVISPRMRRWGDVVSMCIATHCSGSQGWSRVDCILAKCHNRF